MAHPERESNIYLGDAIAMSYEFGGWNLDFARVYHEGCIPSHPTISVTTKTAEKAMVQRNAFMQAHSNAAIDLDPTTCIYKAMMPELHFYLETYA